MIKKNKKYLPIYLHVRVSKFKIFCVTAVIQYALKIREKYETNTPNQQQQQQHQQAKQAEKYYKISHTHLHIHSRVYTHTHDFNVNMLLLVPSLSLPSSLLMNA